MYALELSLFAFPVASHLFMGNPPPFRWETAPIEELVMPLNGDHLSYGQQPFPCKGHHVDITTDSGAPVATWVAGQNVTIQLFDRNNATGPGMDQTVGAAHSGGSCQISFSYDKGNTWVVVQNWEGNCPRVSVPGTIDNHYDLDQNYTFRIPSSFPSGDRVIVAWSWLNASGNREFYMSCSCVTIQGNGPQTEVTPDGPPLLIANLAAQPPAIPGIEPYNDSIWQPCHTLNDTSVEYPPRYCGINPVVRASVALSLQPFPGGNDATCGSDNQDTVSVLGNFTCGPFTPSLVATALETSATKTIEPRQFSDSVVQTSTTTLTAEIASGFLFIPVTYGPMLSNVVIQSASSAGNTMGGDTASTAAVGDDTTSTIVDVDTATITIVNDDKTSLIIDASSSTDVDTSPSNSGAVGVLSNSGVVTGASNLAPEPTPNLSSSSTTGLPNALPSTSFSSTITITASSYSFFIASQSGTQMVVPSNITGLNYTNSTGNYSWTQRPASSTQSSSGSSSAAGSALMSVIAVASVIATVNCQASSSASD